METTITVRSFRLSPRASALVIPLALLGCSNTAKQMPPGDENAIEMANGTPTQGLVNGPSPSPQQGSAPPEADVPLPEQMAPNNPAAGGSGGSPTPPAQSTQLPPATPLPPSTPQPPSPPPAQGGASNAGAPSAGAPGINQAGAPSLPLALGQKELQVSAGATDRDHTIVNFETDLDPAVAWSIVDSNNQAHPLQVSVDGTATFILQSLAAGESVTYALQPGETAGSSVTSTDANGSVTFTAAELEMFSFKKEAAVPDGVDEQYARGGYIHPLQTPSGHRVTGDYPRGGHTHHHGIWSAWTRTQFDGHGVDFWNTADGKGNVDFKALDSTWNGPVHGGLVASLEHIDLVGAQPTVALNETWRLSAYLTHPTAPPYLVFDLDSVQTTAGELPLELEKYTYGGFAMRGNADWSGVEFLTSEGHNRSSGDGTKARWCYIGGTEDGQQRGYAMLGHPDNFRAPQMLRIHSSSLYASISPIKEGAHTIEPGQPYTTRFRVVSFDGPPDAELLDRLWDDYASPPTVALTDAASAASQ